MRWLKEMKLRCLIVEDEPIAQDILKSYVERVGTLEIAGQFTNALAAFSYLEHSPVDLLFLDIKMPQMSGLQLLRRLPRKPKVIIVSAYRDFALDAFDLDVIDYLLKPVSYPRFLKAVAKVAKGEVVDPLIPDKEKPFLFVKGNKQVQKIYVDQILYLESQRDYVKIKLSGDTEVVTRQTISYYEEFLPAQLFLRIHRSFIVAPGRITAFEANRVFVGKQALPVGRNYKQAVADHLKHFYGELKA